jgi:hypothetical protein
MENNQRAPQKAAAVAVVRLVDQETVIMKTNLKSQANNQKTKRKRSRKKARMRTTKRPTKKTTQRRVKQNHRRMKVVCLTKMGAVRRRKKKKMKKIGKTTMKRRNLKINQLIDLSLLF